MPLYKKAWNTIIFESLVLIGVDQASKWLISWWARTVTNTAEPLSGTTLFTITDNISIQYEQNTGVAWSFPIPQYILLPLSLFLLITVIIYANRHIKLSGRGAKTITALVLGGAIGNLIDRATRGFVVDFISVGWWPVFNLADSFLTVGIFLFMLFYGTIRKVR